ncbi:MAG: ammonium transporter [Thermoplasmatota archaeon]
MLVATALVMLMTPGLAFFYGGLVRRKNVMNTLGAVFIALGIVTVQWVVFGYSLAFGPDHGGLIGGLDHLFLNGVSASDPDPTYAATIPAQVFMVFQMMFAIITPALIVGAVVERVKFSSLAVFTLLWATFVYDPLAHWVWGAGGWLHARGALDFAGGMVVHTSSGVAALAFALYLGRRSAHDPATARANNLPFVVLGAGLLWFGWFGFNAGSALASGALATTAFVTTQVATAAASLSWVMLEWIVKGKPTTVGAASGAVAGLVAITPACGFVTIPGALLIGILVSAFCMGAIALKDRLGYDDTLDAFGVHGIGGTWGAIATGLFATVAVNAAGGTGLLATASGALGFSPANSGQLLTQLVGVGATWVYSFVVTLGIVFAIDKMMGLRVSEEHEHVGLDLALHNERGYDTCEHGIVVAAPDAGASSAPSSALAASGILLVGTEYGKKD